MISLRNIRFPVAQQYDLKSEISKKLKISGSAFEIIEISRRAVDCRRKNQPVYDFSAVLDISTLNHPDASPWIEPQQPDTDPIYLNDKHPFIIGMGPAGLFCALEMVENGLEPWLFDMGGDLESRASDVNGFWQGGELKPGSNVQFGEGGAGAFSDGKLTSRARDWAVRRVFDRFIEHGAEPSISYEALPHLGTDGIRNVVRSIREYLISKGCKFQYHHKLEELRLENGKVTKLVINSMEYQPETVILALGNSSRETFRMLVREGVRIEAKPFAVGFRVEHEQAFIDRAIYGSDKWGSILGPATYRLACGDTYSFCMCPGGFVINAASEPGTIVTNGMSFSGRDNCFANSAIVSVVNETDYGQGVFAGVDFQEQLERSAFKDGYHAPAQKVKDYKQDKLSTSVIRTSFTPEVYSRKLSTLIPQAVDSRIKIALHKFDTIIRDFSRDAVFIAPETRTSSPVRILRHEERGHCSGVKNLYAIGEGSGYAGGIISSAADGLRLGMRLKLEKY